MNTIRTLTLAIAFALPAMSMALAQPAASQGSRPAASAASVPMSEGEVRKVDKDAKKITIKHGDLKNLGMPPMTMIFQVQDPALLDRVKAGDRINFIAEKIGGKLVVTKIQPEK